MFTNHNTNDIFIRRNLKMGKRQIGEREREREREGERERDRERERERERERVKQEAAVRRCSSR